MSILSKPNAMSDLSTWLDYLESIHPKTIDLGLERVRAVAERMNLCKPAPFIFIVGGTNGKGTTCRTLEMILLAQGYRVGVYSSPHLVHYAERVRIQNELLANSLHAHAFHQVDLAREDISLTYFEFGTLSALELFKQAHLDVVILEVGLGGRLDATNIVDSDVSVITSIAIDHIDWLGSSRETIGFEKSGIFRANKPAIVGEPDMPESIAQFASKIDAQLHCCQPNLDGDWSYRRLENNWLFEANENRLDNLPIPAIPLANAATALAALSYSQLDVTVEAIKTGLEQVRLPGRFQIINESPKVILDVAHNPHAALYLCQRLQEITVLGKRKLVIGMLGDKDIENTLKPLIPLFDEFYCATLDVPRGTTADVLAAFLPEGTQKYEDVKSAWTSASEGAQIDDLIVVCGSFHTVSEILFELEHLEK